MDIQNQEPLISWDIPEYNDHTRSRRWYITAGIGALLLLLYSVFTANFLFALIIIIAAIILLIQDKRKSPAINFAITPEGIFLGKNFYEYSKFKSFWLYYEPDENKLLFFEFKNNVRPRISIPLLNKNPLHIRKILLKFLEEDLEKENEPLSEQLTRLLKL